MKSNFGEKITNLHPLTCPAHSGSAWQQPAQICTQVEQELVNIILGLLLISLLAKDALFSILQIL